MKRGTGIVAVTALVAMLGTLGWIGAHWEGWDFGIPTIEMAPAKPTEAASVPPPATATARSTAARTLAGTGKAWPVVNATLPSREAEPTAPEKPREHEAGPPYWCFRTYFPNLPWMMSSDPRNAGNGARYETEYIWNGERSLRMDFTQLGDQTNPPRGALSPQRNVLWQAIRAAPYRGQRIAFVPHVRAMSGGYLTAFLRSWDGKIDAPRIAPERHDPAKSPTVAWRGAWGAPRLLLDVPMDAEILYYGIVQAGARPVWIDDVIIGPDPKSAAPDPMAYSGRYQEEMVRFLEGLPPLPIDPNWVWKQPQNLDFEIIDPDENGRRLDDTPPPPC